MWPSSQFQARYFISQYSRFARLSLPVCVFDCRWLWERQRWSNMLTIREMCCSLVFVLLNSEFIELTMIYRYKTVSIRVYQIEPNPFIFTLHTFQWKMPQLPCNSSSLSTLSRCQWSRTQTEKLSDFLRLSWTWSLQTSTIWQCIFLDIIVKIDQLPSVFSLQKDLVTY
jgi:hypothetical protein